MTVLPDVPIGAMWRCVDLHLHTPGVPNFALPPGVNVNVAADRRRLVDDYVQRLVDAEINVAAITDYQGVRPAWFDPIRERAVSEGIIVLPGAELSIGHGAGRGLHLLLVCSPDIEPARIAEAIRFQGSSPDPLFADTVRTGHRDVNLRGTISDALRGLREQLGCAVIAAHALEDNGLLKVLGAEHAAELIRDGLIDAIDHCENARERLRSTGLLTREQLESIACTLSGDPKNLNELGAKTVRDGRRRLTWIKLSKVDAGALRLALHDPQTRVLTRAPERVHHPRICAMEVEGGFLDELKLRFSDDLTTLIGGRGAGKSAILETLRYGLGGDPFTDQTERMSLITNALRSGGQVRLVIERLGAEEQRYEVTRVLGQRPRVTDLKTGMALDVQPMELFGPGGSPVILLQREIQAIARDDGFRRRLLDEIIGDEARSADAAVRRLVEELQRNARAIDELDRQLARRDEYTDQLNKLNVDIAYYEQQGVAEKLERHSSLGSDKARLDTAFQSVTRAQRDFSEGAATLDDGLVEAQRELSEAGSEQSSTLRELADDIASTHRQLTSATNTVLNELAALLRRVDAAREKWPTVVAGLEEDLRRVQRELASGPMDAKRYVDAVSQRTALQPIVAGMTRLEGEKGRLTQIREDLLRRLQDQRRRGFALRRDAAEQVNHVLSGRLRMNVDYLGDNREFEAQMLATLRGSRVTGDAAHAIASAPGVDGAELMHAVRQEPATVAKRFQISETMANRFVNWLTDDPARARGVEVLAPEDRVTIALKVEDGSIRDLAELSSGQKATALLLLLFAQGRRPLLLDQPEDDLDNRFVYDDVVALLRAEKGVADPSRRRQIIIATHNANIPVNGDAELVLSLADEGGRCEVRTRASIDDAVVRREIRTVLEGGAEAFRRRAEKYGGLDDSR